MAIYIQLIQADNTPYRTHCHYNKTFKLLMIILELLDMVFILFVIRANIVDIIVC